MWCLSRCFDTGLGIVPVRRARQHHTYTSKHATTRRASLNNAATERVPRFRSRGVSPPLPSHILFDPPQRRRRPTDYLLPSTDYLNPAGISRAEPLLRSLRRSRRFTSAHCCRAGRLARAGPPGPVPNPYHAAKPLPCDAGYRLFDPPQRRRRPTDYLLPSTDYLNPAGISRAKPLLSRAARPPLRRTT